MTRNLLPGSLPLLAALLAGGCGAPSDSGPQPVQPASQRPAATSDLLVFGDALASGWNSWNSWNTTRATVSSPVYAGTSAFSATYTAAWAGLELHPGSALDATQYTHVRFWIHGGTSGAQKVRFMLRDGASNTTSHVPVAVQAGQWSLVEIALSTLGSPAQISGLIWQEAGGDSTTWSTYHLDDVSLVNKAPQPLALSVDAAAARQAISPDIYGIDNASESLATALRLPVRRWGGNATSRYNYLLDATNTGSDYYFENVSEADNVSGSAADNFVEQDRLTDTKTVMTVPLIGWVAKDTSACSFDSNKVDANGAAVFPLQQKYDVWRTWCGNGVKASDGTRISSGFDVHDTSVAAGASFVEGWVNHLVGRFGTAAQGGVAYYNLDNEPMLWNDTHRDAHPSPTSYDELRDVTYTHAAAIKRADPSAQTLGPVAYGWTAYFYSALDWAPGGEWWKNPTDRNAHGGVAFVPWYLGQMSAYEATHGVRILDYLDLHYYPEAQGLSRQPAGSADTQALRMRATRSLWDPYYVDESWIAEPVRLLPRMREWVAQNYPGTKLAVTEYNFGALDHINGAVAQADVLGLFGREGLHLATLWWYHAQHQPTFEATHPGAFAFRMYRNYDGAGGAFGNTRVSASSTDEGNLSVYAAERSTDGALTVMVVNKSLTESLTAPLSLAGFSAGPSAQVYRYSAANLGAIVREADQALGTNGFTATYPAQSITLFVVPKAG